MCMLKYRTRKVLSVGASQIQSMTSRRRFIVAFTSALGNPQALQTSVEWTNPRLRMNCHVRVLHRRLSRGESKCRPDSVRFYGYLQWCPRMATSATYMAFRLPWCGTRGLSLCHHQTAWLRWKSSNRQRKMAYSILCPMVGRTLSCSWNLVRSSER